ncbi:ABC transporter ATP-binding protein [Butyricicoccus sp. OF10-2]|uniref:ABC transporter ATP-binding protein n=1 Tax=Butyricicoccus sp. OF10-2 TaxID=2292298 RepID=UPI000E5CF1C3|nr:ABC transporter ATP-binding protein [Butyricicoccus sp. OF10-2]RHV83230.1 ABC transporter ATP-binding protein [Butyricicoccus sp. OF10-2]
MSDKLLDVRDLVIEYVTDDGTVHAVNRVDLQIGRGETLGLVGETGAGKTTIALSLLGLIPNPPGRVCQGEIIFEGEDITQKSDREMLKIRGDKISMIFQDPMTALNPIDTVGDQICETIRLHEKISAADAVKRACDALELVGIPAERYGDYPHQFSGGMKQRIVIAIALACHPELLIADEPTTALDVTIQAQVLEMMNQLKKDLGTSMLMITHDLGIVAEMCEKVAIIYAGEIVEFGTVEQIFDHHRHPYTEGLFGSLPGLDDTRERLSPIPGLMPDPTNLPEGCKFNTRCPYCTEECKQEQKLVDVGDGHVVRCAKWKERGEK